METMAWPMEPDEVMQVLRAIQFEHYKWDIFHKGDTSILPDALVLSADEHEMLVEVAEGMWDALRELEEIVGRDPSLLAAVGVPDSLHEAIVGQREDHPRVTRCDFHLTEDGQWLISEFNDDVPSGFAECAGLSKVLTEDWGHRFSGVEFRGELREAVVESFAPFDAVGLVHATGHSEDLQHAALVEDWLEQAGHDTVLGSPANLQVRDGRAHLFETPVDALFRYYPGEWLAELPNGNHWLDATGFLPIMNPVSALAAQSKRFYAAWHEHELEISDAARDRLEQFMPRSVYLSSLEPQDVLDNPKRWVLKGAFGRMGDTVRIGPLMPRPEWEEAVQEAFEIPEKIVAQRRFDTAPVWSSRGMGYPTVGMYLVDGTFAGYFSRLDKGPLIDYDSWHVPTMVEIS